MVPSSAQGCSQAMKCSRTPTTSVHPPPLNWAASLSPSTHTRLALDTVSIASSYATVRCVGVQVFRAHGPHTSKSRPRKSFCCRRVGVGAVGLPLHTVSALFRKVRGSVGVDVSAPSIRALAQTLHTMPPTAKGKSTARTNLGKRLAAVTETDADAPTIEPDEDPIIPKKLRLSDAHLEARSVVAPANHRSKEKKTKTKSRSSTLRGARRLCRALVPRGYTFPHGISDQPLRSITDNTLARDE